MKSRKYRKPILIASLIFLLLLFSIPTAVANEAREADVVHIKADQVVDDDLMAFGQTVIVDGIIEGDLLVFAQSVTVNGTIEGDLLGGAQSIVINGDVQDDIRAGGMAIQVNGSVDDNLLVGAFSVESRPESKIGGDLWIGAFQTLIGGDVAGDIMGGMGGLEIAGNVGGNIDVEVGDAFEDSPRGFMSNFPDAPKMPDVPMGLTIHDSATIDGDVSYDGPSRGQVADSTVAGTITYNEVAEYTRSTYEYDSSFSAALWFFDEVQRLLRLLLIGGLILWISPGLLAATHQKLQHRLLPSLGWGVVTPLAFLIVLFTMALLSFLIGFPFLIFNALTAGYLFIFFYVGAIVVGYTLGAWLINRFLSTRAGNPFWMMGVGLTGVWLLTIVPILGSLVGMIIAFLGLGALLLVAKDQMRGQGAFSPA